MSSSWKICKIAGIPIYVHWTFLILIAFVVYSSLAQGQSPAGVATSVAFILALFGCVVLHELGHALTAQRFGVKTSSIILLPIGGVASLQRIPENPSQELLIALAGPAVNVVIAGALLLAGVSPPSGVNDPHHMVEAGFLSNLLVVNLFLALFNLLPAFPMDGGRVLRALLALRMDYARATRLAATIGKFIAVGLAIWGLESGMPMLVLIALFVGIGGESEAFQVEQRVALKGVQVRAAMLTDFHTLEPHNTLGHAAELLLAGSQTDFPVVHDGQPVGVLTRSSLLEGLTRAGTQALISEFMQSGLGKVEADAPLVPALSMLREGTAKCLLVHQGSHPVGLLTLENIGEYLLVNAALGHGGAPQPASA